MSKLFCLSPGLRVLEKQMQEPPGYRPRGYGICIIEEMDWKSRGNYSEIVDCVISRMQLEHLKKRVEEIFAEADKELIFRSMKHRNDFYSLLMGKRAKALQHTLNYATAVFLLSADEELWDSRAFSGADADTSDNNVTKNKWKRTAYGQSFSVPKGREMKKKKWLVMVMLVLVCSLMFGTTVCAAGTGDVAGAIEGTWKDASAQIKTVVNKVVFPAIDLILAVFFFAKLGTAYFDYRKHGQFEWAAPAILFACLVFTLTAPAYIWTILGM